MFVGRFFGCQHQKGNNNLVVVLYFRPKTSDKWSCGAFEEG